MPSVLLTRSRMSRLFASFLGVLTVSFLSPVVELRPPQPAQPRAASAGKGCTKVGILLPETSSSPRWEAYDHPLLVQEIRRYLPGATIDYANAGGSSTTQQSQAEADLTRGDCILVVGAHDSSAPPLQYHPGQAPKRARDRL